jgi:NAD(P)-dependent dehydrogenase (short-subunit alcohol dehydrogenase family)
MSKHKGKITLITGTNSGTGLATAKRFVDEGAYVFITARRKAELAAAKEIGNNVKGVRGDVSNLDDLDRLFAQIQQEQGGLDVVFTNAGVAKYAPLGAITEVIFAASDAHSPAAYSVVKVARAFRLGTASRKAAVFPLHNRRSAGAVSGARSVGRSCVRASPAWSASGPTPAPS